MGEHRKTQHGAWPAESWLYGPDRPTVLFIPGLSEPARSFRAFARHRVLKKARVSSVLAGVPGNEGLPLKRQVRGSDFSTFAQSIDELVRDFQPALIVTHSLGGNIAIEYAHAGRYDGPLLLIGCPFRVEGDLSRSARQRLWSARRAGFRAEQKAWRLAQKTGVGYRKFPAWLVDGKAAVNVDDRAWLDRNHDNLLLQSPSQIQRLREAGNSVYLWYGTRREDPPPTKKQLRRTPNVQVLRKADATHNLGTWSRKDVAKRILKILQERTTSEEHGQSDSEA